MQTRFLKSLLAIRLVVDLFLICASWLVAYYLRFHTGLDAPQGVPESSLYFKLTPFIAVIWGLVFFAVGFYRRTGHHRSAFIEGLDIIQCSFIATLAFIAFTYFYEEYRYSRLTLVIFGMLQPLFLITGRSLVRKFFRYRMAKIDPRKVLIIGSSENMLKAVELVRSLTFQNVRIIGAMSGAADTSQDEKAAKQMGLPFFNVPRNWGEFFAQNVVDTVYFALSYKDYTFVEQTLSVVADQVTDIKLIPDVLRYTKFSAGIEMIKDTPVVSIHESPLLGIGAVVKRAMDIVGSMAAIAIFSPIMVLVAALIRLTSPGPILYRQTRMGLDGKKFECLKFRSMPIDSEDKTGPVFARADDNRPTWIGRIIRKTSLDELPQFLNVLKGEMSLVGPRPERPVFVNQFRQNIPGYMLRHKVKAGITGWAQVNGWRGNTSIEKRIECDLFYIQNWSVWLDLKIIVLTVEEMVFGKNAY
ncbi:MAG: undecaprenyl-phosphate glucose phosphotransferase [Oligoflexales bacterium]